MITWNCLNYKNGIEILHHSLCTIHMFILKQCLEYLWKYGFWLCFRILQYDASADDLRLGFCLQGYWWLIYRFCWSSLWIRVMQVFQLARALDCMLVAGCPCSMLVYLRDRSAETVSCMYWKLADQSDLLSHPVIAYWHHANQSQHWTFYARRLAK